MLNQVTHQNRENDRTLTNYFKSVVGASKTEFRKDFSGQFPDAPSKIPVETAAQLVTYSNPFLAKGTYNDNFKDYYPAVQKGILLSEEEYDKLVRNIYEKPLYRKPKLGSRPDWIDDEKNNFFPLSDLIRQIKGAKSEKKQKSCVSKFIEEYVEMLKTYREEGGRTGEQVYKCFLDMKRFEIYSLIFFQHYRKQN